MLESQLREENRKEDSRLALRKRTREDSGRKSGEATEMFKLDSIKLFPISLAIKSLSVLHAAPALGREGVQRNARLCCKVAQTRTEAIQSSPAFKLPFPQGAGSCLHVATSSSAALSCWPLPFLLPNFCVTFTEAVW